MSCVSNEFFWIIFSSTRKLLCNVFIYIMSNCFSINYSIKISIQNSILKRYSQFQTLYSHFWSCLAFFSKTPGVQIIPTRTGSKIADVFDRIIRQSSWFLSHLVFTFRFYWTGQANTNYPEKLRYLGYCRLFLADFCPNAGAYLGAPLAPCAPLGNRKNSQNR